MRFFTRLKNEKDFNGRFNYIDIIAIISILIVLGYHLYFLSYGVGYKDETFYYSIVQRLLNGDRILVDEWFVSQLSSVLEFIPYQIAVWVCGGTEGIILVLRYLFFISRVPIACMLWVLLRRYRIWGLLGELTYLCFIDFGAMTFSYYTASLDGLIVASAILFLSNKETRFKYFTAGFIYACAVIAEPFIIILFVFYLFFVLSNYHRNKKNPRLKESLPFLDTKAWLFFFFGCLCCSILLFGYFLYNSNFSIMIKTIPQIFHTEEYDLMHDFVKYPRFFRKVMTVVNTFGIPVIIAFALFVVLIILRMKSCGNKKDALSFRFVSFLVGSTVSIVLFIVLLIRNQQTRNVAWFYFAPFQVPALIIFLLCEKRDKASLGFLVVGFLVSFAIDSSSEVLLGYGGSLCQISFWISGNTLIKEFSSEFLSQRGMNRKKNRFRNKAVKCAGTAIIVLIAFWQINFIRTQIICPAAENAYVSNSVLSLTTQVERGPMKGLKTCPQINQAITMSIEDIDYIKAHLSGPLYIAGKCPYLYLQANVTYACDTTWLEVNWDRRQLEYWRMFPDRIPKMIYIPFYETTTFQKVEEPIIADYLERLKDMFVFNISEGKAGYILNVSGTKF